MSSYDIDDVCDRLDNIESAIKSNQSNLHWVFWGALFWLIVPPFLSDIWHSKVRYAMEYSVGYSQVTAEKEPYDCNFLHSPIGGKGCHYERQVNVIRIRSNQWGGQDVSYDDGKTWTRTAKNGNGDWIESYDDGKTWSLGNSLSKTEPRVTISWERKDD